MIYTDDLYLSDSYYYYLNNQYPYNQYTCNNKIDYSQPRQIEIKANFIKIGEVDAMNERFTGEVRIVSR